MVCCLQCSYDNNFLPVHHDNINSIKFLNQNCSWFTFFTKPLPVLHSLYLDSLDAQSKDTPFLCLLFLQLHVVGFAKEKVVYALIVFWTISLQIFCMFLFKNFQFSTKASFVLCILQSLQSAFNEFSCVF